MPSGQLSLLLATYKNKGKLETHLTLIKPKPLSKGRKKTERVKLVPSLQNNEKVPAASVRRGEAQLQWRQLPKKVKTRASDPQFHYTPFVYGTELQHFSHHLAIPIFFGNFRVSFAGGDVRLVFLFLYLCTRQTLPCKSLLSRWNWFVRFSQIRVELLLSMRKEKEWRRFGSIVLLVFACKL